MYFFGELKKVITFVSLRKIMNTILNHTWWWNFRKQTS